MQEAHRKMEENHFPSPNMPARCVSASKASNITPCEGGTAETCLKSENGRAGQVVGPTLPWASKVDNFANAYRRLKNTCSLRRNAKQQAASSTPAQLIRWVERLPRSFDVLDAVLMAILPKTSCRASATHRVGAFLLAAAGRLEDSRASTDKEEAGIPPRR